MSHGVRTSLVGSAQFELRVCSFARYPNTMYAKRSYGKRGLVTRKSNRDSAALMLGNMWKQDYVARAAGPVYFRTFSPLRAAGRLQCHRANDGKKRLRPSLAFPSCQRDVFIGIARVAMGVNEPSRAKKERRRQQKKHTLSTNDSTASTTPSRSAKKTSQRNGSRIF